MKKIDISSRDKINIFGVDVDDISQKNAIKRVLALAKGRKKGNYVVTVNSEFVMLARRNTEFARILANSDLALADGWWIVFLKLISGGSVQERVTGVDLVENVCKAVIDKPIRIGFLGGFGNVAAEVKKRQKSKLNSLKVVLAESGDPTLEADLRLEKRFGEVGRVDVLFVAYGMGKQEYWIDRMRKKLDVGVFVGVGGSFDYIAGLKKRAPAIWQNLGFEWLWRLMMEPTRIWRQRIIPIFFLMIVGKVLTKFIFPKNK